MVGNEDTPRGFSDRAANDGRWPTHLTPASLANITSGILAAGLHKECGTTLLVDIGVGEMALACNGRLIATSTTSGSVFSGRDIACGMRPCVGAIEAFGIDSRGAVYLSIIGGGAARGICGSGLLDVTAELLTCGVIDRDGRFCDLDSHKLRGTLTDRLVRKDAEAGFRVADQVVIWQNDIRKVQLAKGAMRAGIEILIGEAGCEPAAVGRVLICGAFGSQLRADSLFTVGLLPRELAGKVEFIALTSSDEEEAFGVGDMGQEMAEVKAGVEAGIEARIEVLELAKCPDFYRLFVHSIAFAD